MKVKMIISVFFTVNVISLVQAESGESLWSDSYSMAGDKQRLSRGNNLIYVAAGSEEFLKFSLKNVASAFETNYKDHSGENTRENSQQYSDNSEGHFASSVQLHCMDVTEGSVSSPIQRLKAHTESSVTCSSGRNTQNNGKNECARLEIDANRINLFAVKNVEKIEISELKRLDFLFRVTDKSYERANIVVLLLWNTDERPFTSEEKRAFRVMRDDYGDNYSDDDGTDQDDNDSDGDSENSGNEGREDEDVDISLKGFLAAEWTKGGPLVNGDALVGRIARTVHDSKYTVSTDSTGQDPDGSILDESMIERENKEKTENNGISATSFASFCDTLRDEMKITAENSRGQMDIRDKAWNERVVGIVTGLWTLISQNFFNFVSYSKSGLSFNLFCVYFLALCVLCLLISSYRDHLSVGEDNEGEIVSGERTSERIQEEVRTSYLKMVVTGDCHGEREGHGQQTHGEETYGQMKADDLVDLCGEVEEEEAVEEEVEDVATAPQIIEEVVAKRAVRSAKAPASLPRSPKSPRVHNTRSRK